MKTLRFFILALLTVGLSSALADDAPAKLHWYKVAIKAGSESTSFVGTSDMDANALGDMLHAKSAALTLENLRELANTDGKGYTWHKEVTALRVVIMPDAVLYFYELTGDPMQPGKGAP